MSAAFAQSKWIWYTRDYTTDTYGDFFDTFDYQEGSVICNLSVDGEKNVDILSEDTVKIRKSELCLELISLRKRNFFKLLNEKLKEREM